MTSHDTILHHVTSCDIAEPPPAALPPKMKRGSTHHSDRSAPTGEMDVPRKKKMKSSKHVTRDHTPPLSSTPRDRPPSRSSRDPPSSSTPRDPPPSSTPRDPPPSSTPRDHPTSRCSRDPPPSSGPRDAHPLSGPRDQNRKDRVKKEKRHKDRTAGRTPAGQVPAPPISQKGESVPPISQKVESSPPTGPQVPSYPEDTPLGKSGKTSARAEGGNKKKVKRVKRSTETTAGAEKPRHPEMGPHIPLAVKPFQEAKPAVVPLLSGSPPQQLQGSKRPGKLVLGEGTNSKKGTHLAEVGPSGVQAVASVWLALYSPPLPLSSPSHCRKMPLGL